MGRVMQQGSATAGLATTDAVTSLWPPLSYLKAGTEDFFQIPCRSAYTVSGFGTYCSQNDVSSASTLRIRKNKANGTCAISITGNTTGLFEDTTHSDSFATATPDKITTSITVPSVAGTHTCTLTTLFYMLTASSNTFEYLSGVDTGQGYATTTVNYLNFGDLIRFGNTTENRVSYKYYTAGTMKNGSANLTANTRDSATTVKSRLNGADGAIAISITAATSGLFEDTTHTDTIASGDLYNYAIAGAAGTGTNTFGTVAVQFETTTNQSHIYTDYPLLYTTGASETSPIPLCGDFGLAGTEAPCQLKARFPMTVTNLECRVNTNTATSDGTLTFRKTAADTALTLTITAGITGLFEDAANSVTIATGDLINFRLVTGATNGIQPAFFGCMIEDTTPAATTKQLAALGVG